MEKQTVTSLSRFKISDEDLIADIHVKESINSAYNQGRCFEFYPSREIIEKLRSGESTEHFRDAFDNMCNTSLRAYTEINGSVHEKHATDTRLFNRIEKAIEIFHLAAAGNEVRTLPTRRIVLVIELPGKPTIHHISENTTVIAHVGLGPDWSEIPTVYLGLKIFDTLSDKRFSDREDLLKALTMLLEVEERAIETGYSHATVYPPEYSKSLNYLVDSVIKLDRIISEEYETEKPAEAIPSFDNKIYSELIAGLNSRLSRNEMEFDFETNNTALNRVENYARLFKEHDKLPELKKVVSLLVAASGHDIHEIRNRANILLDRVFSPKEFDAPLATKFYNIKAGDIRTFSFTLPDTEDGSAYYLKVYSPSNVSGLHTSRDIRVNKHELKKNDSELYTCSLPFNEYGHYDFIVVSEKGGQEQWLNEYGCSGRVNVIPNVRGEIILEIFVDIHGHTRTYWSDNDGHPGLVYNENGQVIRLGNFDDVTAHLKDLKERLSISAIYLLGVQRRGTNREDWAPEATSPSPFSPMSLTEIEPSLGGKDALKRLIDEAHHLDLKVVVDIIPHINRKSDHLPDTLVVKTYNHEGQLVPRSSTDGRYGSWDDGKLLNYRIFEVWEWLADSICSLMEELNIDGIRFDSAHAVPIMMKKNNYPMVYGTRRTDYDMLTGSIIVNDREFDHFITTGYYDSQCRENIAVPLHYFLMLRIDRTLKKMNRDFFINIAECFWGHERFLTRTGLIPYNASLFKICENISHGKSDVREIYHIYDNHYPSILPEGTDLLGILGNHDERRALNTFGHRGLRAAVALTSFMSNIILDYEGSAEGEGWKVFLDNIYVNWNDFEYASHRSVETLYKKLYTMHKNIQGNSYLIWANNNMVAAAIKHAGDEAWIGIFNFSDSNQGVSLQFDSPSLELDDDDAFILSDPLYSPITDSYGYYTAKELKISRINTTVTYTERIKFLKLKKISTKKFYKKLITDSFNRLCELDNTNAIESNFVFSEISQSSGKYRSIRAFINNYILNNGINYGRVEFGLKRILFHLYDKEIMDLKTLNKYLKKMTQDEEPFNKLGEKLRYHFRKGSIVFLSAEVEPFSKSGGLANVVYELPREMASLGEDIYIITPLYRDGTDKEREKIQKAVKTHNVRYTGTNVNIKIMDGDYSIGVHYAEIDNMKYYLLDHHEFFNGLYWGVTSEEKLRRRIAFARASAEVVLKFNINIKYALSNDAFTGLFGGIVRCDHYYDGNPIFRDSAFLHIIHNGGWQYFDSYDRYEKGFDLFNLFNLPGWNASSFLDPVFGDRLNCMASGIRFSKQVITVSPSYARQIEIACDGLEHILHNVRGISNAIGSDFRSKIEKNFAESGFAEYMYEPLLDRIKSSKELHEKITSRYPEILEGNQAIEKIKDGNRKKIIERMRNKLMLQLNRNLEVNPDIILATMIHRISEQKGFQLLLEASEGIVKDLGYQLIIGGGISSGDRAGESIAHGLYLLGEFYPERVNVSFGFQDVSIPLLSSDYFLMPSMHEPGGISQLEAMAAGCPPIARATGGLRDTIKSLIYSENHVEGYGFLFSDFSSWSFYDAMERASKFFHEAGDEMFLKVRELAENASYNWEKPALEYIDTLYRLNETIKLEQ